MSSFKRYASFIAVLCFLTGFLFMGENALARKVSDRFANGEMEAQREASLALIKRVIPGHWRQFRVRIVSGEVKKDFFELQSRNGNIIIGGNNGVSIASG